MSDPQWGLLIYMYMLFLFFVLFLLSCAQMTSKAPAIDSSQRELSKSDEFLGEGGTEVVGGRSEVVWDGGSEGVRSEGSTQGSKKQLLKRKNHLLDKKLLGFGQLSLRAVDCRCFGGHLSTRK